MRSHRLKFTTTRPPERDDPEGYRAAWWRERILGFSRPQLAEALDLSSTTILVYERSNALPVIYGLACAALQVEKISRMPFFADGKFVWPT